MRSTSSWLMYPVYRSSATYRTTPVTAPTASSRTLDLGRRRRKAVKTAPDNSNLRLPENTSTLKAFLMKKEMRIRDVTPASVREIAEPLNPRTGVRMKREIIYCTAAPAINILGNLGFPIPIIIEERVYPNMRRNVPTMRI